MYNENNWYLKSCRAVARIFRAKFRGLCSKIDSESKYRKLKDTLKFANLKLEPADVLLFSYFISFTLCLSLLAIFAPLYFLNRFQNILLFLPFTMLLPLAIAHHLANYPKYYAQKLKLKSLGKLPEAVNYLGVGMQVTPQLENTVKLAAENTEEPLGSAFKKVLWNVYLRKHTTIENSILSFANDFGDDDFKQALYLIMSAELESRESGREKCIEKASELVITSTKSRIDSFANSLTAPTMTLFSMGILLPMILSAMLPLIALGGIRLTALEILALLIFIFPSFTASYAYHILSKRPSTIELSSIPNSQTKISNILITIVACGIVSIIIFLGFFLSFVLKLENIITLSIIAGIGTGIGFWFKVRVKARKEERDKLRKLEEELPDALFILGSRITENQPLEKALKDTSQLLSGSNISELLNKICYRTNLERLPIDNALFGKNGVLEYNSSKMVKTAFRALVKTTEKDNLSAGRSLARISNYLRNLKKVENDIKNKLGSAIAMMQATALYFAPLVLGITCALHKNLSSALVGVSGMDTGGFGVASTAIPPTSFSLIMALYLIILVVIILYFCSGILYGADSIERNYQIGKIMPKATLIFVSSAIIGQLVIAV